MRYKNLQQHKTNPFEISGELSPLPIHDTLELIIKRKDGVNDDEFNADVLDSYVSTVSRIMGLSSVAEKVFMDLFNEDKYIQGKYFLNVQELTDQLGYKSTTVVYKAVCDLVDRGVMAKSKQKFMWHLNKSVIKPPKNPSLLIAYRVV